MRALVTGAAGFIGSHLCGHLLEEGDDVVGVDCFTPYYDRSRKESNLGVVLARKAFEFLERDLRSTDTDAITSRIDVVYHLAAQPGVRASWGPDFSDYVGDNVLATQRLLESCAKRAVPVVYASSSSIYGEAEALPTRETAVPSPISPYGVTKLAGEHLVRAYGATGGLRSASLRLFTVYGPRQRPDMAFARLISAALAGETFEVFGDGEQTRDFTYVSDVVRAFRLCAASGWSGVANIGGGSRTALNEVIAIVEDICGPVKIDRRAGQRGDVRHTGADTSLAAESFGWSPEVTLREGLEKMIEAERTLA